MRNVLSQEFQDRVNGYQEISELGEYFSEGDSGKLL